MLLGGGFVFHQVAYSVDYDFFRVEHNKNFSFPAHAHACFEVLFVRSGEMEVEVAGNRKILHENEGAFIFPNQIHALKTPKGSTSAHTLCIFSPTLVRHFYKEHQTTVPENSFYRVDPLFLRLIQEIESENSKSVVKGSLYLVCGDFEKQTAFIPCDAMDTNGNNLISQIFTFIEKNASQDCSLSKLAGTLPYSYVHLSRFFKQTCGITFVEYVNHYRVSEACYLLKNTDKPITDICLECGYSSVRSFNRNFKDVTGMTPREYQRRSAFTE